MSMITLTMTAFGKRSRRHDSAGGRQASGHPHSHAVLYERA